MVCWCIRSASAVQVLMVTGMPWQRCACRAAGTAVYYMSSIHFQRHTAVQTRHCLPCGPAKPLGAFSSTVGVFGPPAPSSCSCRASPTLVTSRTQLLLGSRVDSEAPAEQEGRLERTGVDCPRDPANSPKRSNTISSCFTYVIHTTSC